MAFSKFLDPKNDYLFKRLFGTEKNKDILIHFINSVLHLEGEDAIQDVTYLQTDLNPEYAYKKQSMVDVLCRDIKGTQFIIEMQVAKFSGFEERAQFYAAKAYINQMDVGEKYQDLKEVIFITITDYVMFPDKTTWKSDHVTLDKKTFENDLKAFSFTFIELPKFTKALDELSTIEEKWVYFFKHAHETLDKDLTTLLGDDVVLKKAFDESTKYSMSEREWNSYEAALKHERDARAIEDYKIQQAEEKGIAKGLEKGIAKGMEKGIAKGMEKGIAKGLEKGKSEGEKAAKIEIARNLKSMNLTVDQIKAATGLTEDEIKAIVL
ncbi:MAG: Rpn family recombination-promoting nuclease/putative transposase [Alphaproteobacteria bacterium]|nr:Rpn family recombination-promoting nuclease/putative transposase [Alphaproteobacteria bacterium]